MEESPKKSSPWWKDAKLRFKCEGCGKCCTRKGVVFFNNDDIKRASKYLELDEDTFRKTYLVYSRGYYFLTVKGRIFPCHFLTKDKKCRINDAKPAQCSLYPFWPQVLESKLKWDNEAIHCKGMNQGKEINVSEYACVPEELEGLTEEATRDIMLLINCGEHYKVEEDNTCRATMCAFNADPATAKKIADGGCRVYRVYESMEKQRKEGKGPDGSAPEGEK